MKQLIIVKKINYRQHYCFFKHLLFTIKKRNHEHNYTKLANNPQWNRSNIYRTYLSLYPS